MNLNFFTADSDGSDSPSIGETPVSSQTDTTFEVSNISYSLTTSGSVKKRKRGERRRNKVSKDPSAVMLVVSNLLMSHFSNDKSRSYCTCLNIYKTSPNGRDVILSLFQSCREYMSLFDELGESGRRRQMKEFLHGNYHYIIDSFI